MATSASASASASGASDGDGVTATRMTASTPAQEQTRKGNPFGFQSWDPQASVTERVVPLKSGVWLTPAIHNKNAVRALAIAGAVVLSAQSSIMISSRLAWFLHFVAFGCWLGTSVYTTFIAGIVMFRNLPRQTFGKLQARLFPRYFQLNAASLLVLLVSFFSLSRLPYSLAIGQPLLTLGLSLVCTLANLVVLEPWATRVMLERYDLENAGDKTSDAQRQLAKRFGMLHGLSSLVNMVSLTGGFVHAWWLSSLAPIA
eukprot:jgi/Chlat1/3623/Chrsp237S03613